MTHYVVILLIKSYIVTIMAKRVRLPHTKTYMKVRERSTSAGKKGTFIEKWSPTSRGTAQAKVGRRAAKQSVSQFGKTLKWLGGADRK